MHFSSAIGLIAALTQLLKYIFQCICGISRIITIFRKSPILVEQWNERVQNFDSFLTQFENYHSLHDAYIQKTMERCRVEINNVKVTIESVMDFTTQSRTRKWMNAWRTLQMKNDIVKSLRTIAQLTEDMKQCPKPPTYTAEVRRYGSVVPLDYQTATHHLDPNRQSRLPLRNQVSQHGMEANSWRENTTSQFLSSIPVPQRHYAANLLAIVSCLNSRNIPKTLIANLPEKDRYLEAFSLLEAQQLIIPRTSNTFFDSNPLVSELVRKELLLMPILHQHAKLILRVIDLTFTSESDESGVFKNSHCYALHVVSLIDFITKHCPEDQLDDDALGIVVSLASRAAHTLTQVGSYREATVFVQKILSWGPAFFSSSIIAASALWGRLAIAEYCTGNNEEASRLTKDVLRTRKTFVEQVDDEAIEVFGISAIIGKLPSHTEALGSYSIPPSLFGGPLCSDLLSRPSNLANLSKLSLSIQLLGRFEEAEAIQHVCLAGWRQVLGAEHPESLKSMSNLGIILHCQGRSKESEILLRNAATMFEASLGRDHDNTLQAYQIIACILHDMSRYRDAEDVLRKCLCRMNKGTRGMRPGTVRVLEHLSVVLQWQQRFEESLNVAQEVLDIRMKKLGVDHAETLSSKKHVKELKALVDWVSVNRGGCNEPEYTAK